MWNIAIDDYSFAYHKLKIHLEDIMCLSVDQFNLKYMRQFEFWD